MLRAALYALTFLSVMPLSAQAQGGDEVPFITTPDNVTLEMLRLGGVGAKDYVVDLGSGDGRIVIAAAQRFGARGLGVELVGELVARSRAAAARAGVGSRAEFREQDLFQTDLTPATVITMYLLQEVNLQLGPAILALEPGCKGCGAGATVQRFGSRSAMSKPGCAPAHRAGRRGRLDGNTMRLLGSDIAALAGRFDGDTLVLGSGTPVMPALKWPAGTRLARTVGERCP